MIEEPPVQQGFIDKVATDTYTLNPELFGADQRTGCGR